MERSYHEIDGVLMNFFKGGDDNLSDIGYPDGWW